MARSSTSRVATLWKASLKPTRRSVSFKTSNKLVIGHRRMSSAFIRRYGPVLAAAQAESLIRFFLERRVTFGFCGSPSFKRESILHGLAHPSNEVLRTFRLLERRVIRRPLRVKIGGQIIIGIPKPIRSHHPYRFTAQALAQGVERTDLVVNPVHPDLAIRVARTSSRQCGGMTPSMGTVPSTGKCCLRLSRLALMKANAWMMGRWVAVLARKSRASSSGGSIRR